MKKIFLLLIIVLLGSCAYCAKPILSGMNDLLIISSLGYDRNPCFLEWYQYDQNWNYFDSKVIRSTNETWIGGIGGDINNDGYIDFLTSVDNNQGYSHVRTYPIDRYASMRENATIYDNLPNEPWRHITGVEYADIDGDGQNDLLMISNDKDGDRHITCIFYKDGKISGETILCDVPKGAWNMSLCNNVIYVTVHDPVKIITNIMAYNFDQDWTLKNKAIIATYKKEQGKITGIAVREMGEKELEIILCGHNWDKFEADVNEVEHKGGSAKDTYFLLPNVDLNNTTSFLARCEIKNKKITPMKKFEEIKGRRWQDITFVKPFDVKPYNININYNPTKDCLHIMGLFSNSYELNKYFSNIDKWYVKVEAQTESLIKTNINDLGNYKYVVVNNVPIYALGEEGINALMSYAKNGGCVIFANGLMSGATGGFKDSDFINSIGITLGRASKVDYTDKGVPYICNTKSDSPILTFNNDVLFSVKEIGKGKIYYIGITPNKEDLTEFHNMMNDIMKQILG